MGLMSTLAIGAAGYWLYRSGRLDPYVRQLKESSLFKQLKDKAGMGTGMGSTTTTPFTTTTSYGAGADLSDPHSVPTGTMRGKEVEPYA